MTSIPIGIQLYTVREDLSQDPFGTLRELAGMGYQGIELAGLVDRKVEEWKRWVDDLDLRVAGSHAPLEELQKDLDRIMDEQETLDNHRLVLPWLPEEIQNQGSEGYRQIGEFLDEVSEKIAPRGFSISYHNHSFEFLPDGKGYLLDTLLEAGSKKNFKFELDTYWVRHGGVDPEEYMRKYRGRIELLHIKDMGPGEQRPFTEIGSGILDWEGIFKAAQEVGVEWFIVEQDVCSGPALESARKSLEYLKSRGLMG